MKDLETTPQERESTSSYYYRLSSMGRNLIVIMALGLVAGGGASIVAVNGVPLIYYLIQYNSLVVHGMIWQLVSSMIISPFNVSGLVDVGFNALAVYFLDPLLSAVYSEKQYFTVFFATGIFGNILSLFGLGLGGASFGASGGLFGLVAGAVTFDYALNQRVNQSLLIWFVIIFVFSSFLFPNVDYFAHLGGAILGALLGYRIGNARRREFFYRISYRTNY
ncbi:MAG: rhomboid family intramembrane serine protease [Thermoprotei archaeon]